MAEPKRNHAAAVPKKDRQPDIEALAASLFVQQFMASTGAMETAGIARKSLSAAREFYQVCDEPREQ